MTEPDTDATDAVDLKIAALLIEKPTATDQEIATKLGVSRQTINRRRNSSQVKSLVRSSLAIPEKEVRRLAVKAFSRLEELLDHEDPRIKLAATISMVKLGSHFVSDSMTEAMLKGMGTI